MSAIIISLMLNGIVSVIVGMCIARFSSIEHATSEEPDMFIGIVSIVVSGIIGSIAGFTGAALGNLTSFETSGMLLMSLMCSAIAFSIAYWVTISKRVKKIRTHTENPPRPKTD